MQGTVLGAMGDTKECKAIALQRVITWVGRQTGVQVTMIQGRWRKCFHSARQGGEREITSDGKFQMIS